MARRYIGETTQKKRRVFERANKICEQLRRHLRASIDSDLKTTNQKKIGASRPDNLQTSEKSEIIQNNKKLFFSMRKKFFFQFEIFLPIKNYIGLLSKIPPMNIPPIESQPIGIHVVLVVRAMKL